MFLSRDMGDTSGLTCSHAQKGGPHGRATARRAERRGSRDERGGAVPTAGGVPQDLLKWRARFLTEGMAGLEPRRSTPRSSPRRIPDVVEQAIVEKRKWLLDFGLDAGPESIRDHLVNRGLPMVPSRNTIWRVLVRRGFVTPQPQKRPRVSCVRFEAAAPNECWQIDATEWRLSNRKVVEVINIIDDHSRLAVATKAVEVTTTHAAWEAFEQAAMTWGFPTRCLSDNGLAFTGRLRRMEVFFQVQLRKAGVRAVNSRPRHPQTCGKVCEHHGGAARSRSDPGQGMTNVSFARFVDRLSCCVTARADQTELT